MEDVDATEFSSGGFFRKTVFPESKIYVSSGSEIKRSFVIAAEPPDAVIHYFLIHDAGANYTEEMVKNCQGNLSCFNCNSPIKTQIYFYPQEYTQLGDFICSPLPHCCKPCMLRTITDIPNNSNLLSNFFLMYGPNVKCASPRECLYLPGGLSLEQYHDMNEVTIEPDSREVRSFLAPKYYSITMFKNHQLVDDSKKVIDFLTTETKSSIGPQRAREQNDMTVVVMPTSNNLSTIPLVFNLNPVSNREKM
jgi:hypothetical protein